MVPGAAGARRSSFQLFRIGPAAAFDSLWAEDGQVFLQGAMTSGLIHNLFATYAGLPRLRPAPDRRDRQRGPAEGRPGRDHDPLRLVVGLSGLAVWFGSSAHIRNPYLRGVLVALTVLPPVASLESIASGAYVLWYMFFASFWLLLWRPATAGGRCSAAPSCSDRDEHPGHLVLRARWPGCGCSPCATAATR